MKKIIVILMPLILLSCISYKNEKLDQKEKIQRIFASEDFIVNFPKNWTYNLDHNSIAYTPKNLNDAFYKCLIHVFEYNGSILEVGPLNQVFNTEKYLKKFNMPKKIQTRFGETDIYKVVDISEYSYNKSEVETITVIYHFSYNDKFYILRYSAVKKYYEKYLNDIDYFIKNLEFKKTSK